MLSALRGVGAGAAGRGEPDETDNYARVSGGVSALREGQHRSGGGAIDGVKERSECDRRMRTYRVQHCKGRWFSKERIGPTFCCCSVASVIVA